MALVDEFLFNIDLLEISDDNAIIDTDQNISG